MSTQGETRDNLPPELLAAYADGELSPAEQCRVECWLADHPEARADVEAQRRLARLFEEATPPLPAEGQWADALAAVERGLATPPVRRVDWRRRLFLAGAALAAAAALLLVLLRKDAPRETRPDETPAAEEAWPVASADDVLILSMDDRDRGALVVGEPPVNEPLQLLAADEVQVNKVPDWQGRVGRLFKPEGPGAPVIMSLPSDSDEDP
jgi:hypothetical protein